MFAHSLADWLTSSCCRAFCSVFVAWTGATKTGFARCNKWKTKRPTAEGLTSLVGLAELSALVQFGSVPDGIFALGKAHMRSTPSLRSFPNVAFETVAVLESVH